MGLLWMMMMMMMKQQLMPKFDGLDFVLSGFTLDQIVYCIFIYKKKKEKKRQVKEQFQK